MSTAANKSTEITLTEHRRNCNRCVSDFDLCEVGEELHEREFAKAEARSVTAATRPAAETTARPWHVYEGGNFVRIGAEGYDEYTDRESYLGGPLCVANMEYRATESHDSDHDKALANAALIVRAVNNFDALREAARYAQRNINACLGSDIATARAGLISVERALAAALAASEGSRE